MGVYEFLSSAAAFSASGAADVLMSTCLGVGLLQGVQQVNCDLQLPPATDKGLICRTVVVAPQCERGGFMQLIVLLVGSMPGENHTIPSFGRCLVAYVYPLHTASRASISERCHLLLLSTCQYMPLQQWR
jgi:hypothetical protein